MDESDIEDHDDDDDEDVEDLGNKFAAKKSATSSSSSSALTSFYAKHPHKGSAGKANDVNAKHRVADEKYRGKESTKKRKAGKKGTRVEIEYEQEEEEPAAKVRVLNDSIPRKGGKAIDF